MTGRVTNHLAKEDLCRMNRMMDGYGPHLMLDLGECNPVILNDLDACFNLLNELPKKRRGVKSTFDSCCNWITVKRRLDPLMRSLNIRWAIPLDIQHPKNIASSGFTALFFIPLYALIRLPPFIVTSFLLQSRFQIVNAARNPS